MPLSLLYPYQQEALAFLERRDGKAGLFMEMGTGKTRVAMAYFSHVSARRTLVICPISASSAWRNEIKKLGLTYVVYDLTTGTLAERKKILAVARRDQRPYVVIINLEVFWRKPLSEAVARLECEAMAIDEAHRIKGRGTRQSSRAYTLGRKYWVKHRLALTGTPIMNGLQDLFAIYRFIDPSVFGTNWDDFSARYLTYGGYYNHEIVGYINEDEAADKMARTAFEISQSEALNLPKPKDQIVEFDLSKKARKQYDLMKKESLAAIEGTGPDGLPVKGLALARIVLTGLLRLQQMTGGYVKTEDAGIIDISDEKLRLTVDLIQDATAGGRRVVVFCRFTHDLARLKDRLPGAVVINGKVSPRNRERAIERLNRGDANVALVQIAVGSESIDLTAASVGIFYSVGFSLGEMRQARSRLYRHGQKRRVMFYHMIARDSVDSKIYAALRNKQFNARRILSLDYARDILS